MQCGFVRYMKENKTVRLTGFTQVGVDKNEVRWTYTRMWEIKKKTVASNKTWGNYKIE